MDEQYSRIDKYDKIFVSFGKNKIKVFSVIMLLSAIHLLVISVMGFGLDSGGS